MNTIYVLIITHFIFLVLAIILIIELRNIRKKIKKLRLKKKKWIQQQQ